jgi:hypothetical protein
MDVARTLLLSLLFVYLIPAAAEVEYISPERQTQLEDEFNKATFDVSQDAKRLAGHSWSCDMYGARSHMQVQHGLKLYAWKEKAGQWSNSGAQLVSEYVSQNSSLTGRKDRFEDQVKITKDGQLISRLTLADGSKSVLAYSVCKTL